MRASHISSLLLAASGASGAVLERQNGGGFGDGQPIDGNGKGAPILGEFLDCSSPYMPTWC